MKQDWGVSRDGRPPRFQERTGADIPIKGADSANDPQNHPFERAEPLWMRGNLLCLMAASGPQADMCNLPQRPWQQIFGRHKCDQTRPRRLWGIGNNLKPPANSPADTYTSTDSTQSCVLVEHTVTHNRIGPVNSGLRLSFQNRWCVLVTVTFRFSRTSYPADRLAQGSLISRWRRREV
jgi:hypothetical protein